MNWTIRGETGFPDTPFYTIESNAELASCVPVVIRGDYTGTISNPKQIWGASGGYLKTYTSGDYQFMMTKEINGSGTGLVSGPDYIVVIGWSIPSGNNYVNRVVWLGSDSADYHAAMAELAAGHFTTDNLLYMATEADQLPSFVTEDREWDETPSEDQFDPDNLSPAGGGYADIGSMAQTDMMPYSGLPDPNSDMTMNFSSFVTCFCLSESEMTNLGLALFNAGFWGNLKNKFEGLSDPLSMILECHQIPLTVPGSTGSFQLGGVMPEYQGNPVSCTRTQTRYVKSDMGSITLKEIFGSAKDYTNVSIQIYLPYVGMKDLDPDLVVGNTLSLRCYVDVWTGDVLYLLHVSNATREKKYFPAESVPYRWNGNCAKSIPLGRVDNSRMIMNMVGTIATVGAGLATFGVGAAAGLGAAGTAGTAAAGTEAAAAGGANAAMMQQGAMTAGSAISQAASSGFSPIVQSSGGIAGGIGQMDYQNAYIIVKRGIPKYPNGWRDTIGAPQFQTYGGAACTGYTLFSEIHLPGTIGLTDLEMAELERELKTEGVIL